MTTSTTARLTKHQESVLDDLCHYSSSRGDWVAESIIGAKAALGHLIDKGLVVKDVEIGPRGGELRYYRPARFGPSRKVALDREVPAVALSYFKTSDIDIDQLFTPGTGWIAAPLSRTVTLGQLRFLLESKGVTAVVLRGCRPGEFHHRLADFTIAELLS